MIYSGDPLSQLFKPSELARLGSHGSVPRTLVRSSASTVHDEAATLVVIALVCWPNAAARLPNAQRSEKTPCRICGRSAVDLHLAHVRFGQVPVDRGRAPTGKGASEPQMKLIRVAAGRDNRVRLAKPGMMQARHPPADGVGESRIRVRLFHRHEAPPARPPSSIAEIYRRY